MSKELKFSLPTDTKDDQVAIGKIVDRAVEMAARNGFTLRPLDIMMDVKTTHANGNPLRLQELADADDFNFSHDVFGIRRHLNRTTGKLEHFFVPRFSRRHEKPAVKS